MPLNAAGLFALAEIDSVPLRSALTGTSSLLDLLVVCPGLHRQHDAPSLSKGEYPACANISSGYVFRVENEATVLQLQRLGKSGHLITLEVSSRSQNGGDSLHLATICYTMAVAATLMTAMVLWRLKDFGALRCLVTLILIRTINVLVVRRRSRLGWKGAREEDKINELLVLLSQDRWIRIRGLVNDIKTVTSGQWLRDMTPMESSLTSFATLLAYLNAALPSGTGPGHVVLVMLLFVSAFLLGMTNQYLRTFSIYGTELRAVGAPIPYERRLHLAKQLIEESGREDWAIGLGMIQDKAGKGPSRPKIM